MTNKAQPSKSKPVNKLAGAAPAVPRKVGVNIHVPANIHRRFRIAALEKDMTLADAIILAMDEWAAR